jgi:hypothetical protein
VDGLVSVEAVGVGAGVVGVGAVKGGSDQTNRNGTSSNGLLYQLKEMLQLMQMPLIH